MGHSDPQKPKQHFSLCIQLITSLTNDPSEYASINLVVASPKMRVRGAFKQPIRGTDCKHRAAAYRLPAESHKSISTTGVKKGGKNGRAMLQRLTLNGYRNIAVKMLS